MKKNAYGKMLCLAAIALALGAAADPAWDVRAVQLDLARQMETVPFLKRYLSVAKESGYTAVVLYLEGRVRTPSFPYRSRASRVPGTNDRLVSDIVCGCSVLVVSSVCQFRCPVAGRLAERQVGN